MDITFSWNRNADRITPISTSNLLNHDGISLLDCVLMDDGGLPDSETIPWLDEGLSRIKSVTSGVSKSLHCGRETWGVEFHDNTAKIYSLHDESYFQVLNLDAFLQILQAWTTFVRSKPVASVNLHIQSPTIEETSLNSDG